jgi:flagella basal body P-ring formation protein FlgA
MKTALSFLFAVMMVSAGLDDAGAATLRNRATVDADVIRIGDLFAGAGKAANTLVAPAPQAGETRVFDAGALQEIARQARLDWAPRTRFDRTTVERMTVTLSTDDVMMRIQTALIDAGMPIERRISLSKRDLTVTSLPGERNGVRVESARFDERVSRFAAVLVVPRGTGAADRVHVTGRIHEILRVPVLTRRLNRGEVIGRGDVDLVELPRDGLARNVVLDPDALVGMTPRRLLSANTPLRPGDVAPPVIVSKGTLVTLVVRTDRMLITARGKALQDAAQGETVRVLNIRSRSTIEGVVQGPNQVVVNTPAVGR